jgi:hypothetical protein
MDDLALTALTVFEQQFWSAPTIQETYGDTTALTSCRALRFDDTGHVVETGSAQLAVPEAGTDTASLPPQCSIVVSLRTPISGARGRGRMYLPATSPTWCSSIGRFNPDKRDAFSLRMALFFNALNLDPTFPTVAVASNVGGFVTSVTSVQVGDVVDTQRRRRDALPEAYATNLVTI